MALHFRIHVDAPPEAVFDVLSDVKRHTEWANPKARLAIEEVSGGPPAVGSKYRSTGVFVGKTTSADIEITKLDRPRVFAYRVMQRLGDKGTNYEQTYALTPSDGGTDVEKTTWSGGNQFVFLLAYPAIRGDTMTSLRNLKTRLESSTPG